jgi:prepilin-type N-terminal cleavage/methylation domain-containing protein
MAQKWLWFRVVDADEHGRVPRSSVFVMECVPMSTHKPQAGFSLVELLTVIAVMGIMFAMAIPAYRTWANSNALSASAQQIAGEIQSLRARAMATGQPQTIHFNYHYGSAGDYHIHNGSIGPHWDLPNGITYAHFGSIGFQVTRDGRVSNSLYIILKDRRNNRDTVSVELSGLVLVR